MKISPEKLYSEAESSGFRPDMLEKVAHLLNLLNMLQRHPFLKNKLILKGGTALNLFILKVPRLSVDIDLNYVGTDSRNLMLQERPKVEQAVTAVFTREGFTVRRMPEEHAGGKWSLRYQNAFGQSGNLEVDINFMFRVPLWPIQILDSHMVGTWQATKIPVIDRHELAAGKLSALFSRGKARDLFDSHWILRMDNLDCEKLRIAFVVYGAMNRKDWRTVSIEGVDFDTTDLQTQLVPTLHAETTNTFKLSKEYGKNLLKECKDELSVVLPFRDTELEFLNQLLENGEVIPDLLTTDTSLQERIHKQPLLKWKALNVKKFKGKF